MYSLIIPPFYLGLMPFGLFPSQNEIKQSFVELVAFHLLPNWSKFDTLPSLYQLLERYRSALQKRPTAWP